MVQLTWWNQKTYNEVISFLNKSDRCAIIQAYGSGKSSIIMKLLEDYENDEKIIIAPQDTILDKSYESNVNWTGKNVTLLTYPGLLSMLNKTNFDEFKNVKLIIADELHRTGAPQWGAAFELLLETCSKAKVVGATATPRRFDQKKGSMDMVEVYFGDNRAGNWGLADCISQNILPIPLYIASMYTLQDEINERLEKLKSDRISEEDRAKITSTLNGLRVDWEELHSVKDILVEHLKPSSNLNEGMKILVFCKTIEHIKDVRKSMDETFSQIFSSAKRLELMEFHNKTNNKSFEKFCEKSNKGEVKVLYAVDKFNEGVHVDDLNAVVLLRQTKSEIIYLQQIGRVLSMGGDKNPIIFDLVNNFKSLRNYEIWDNFEKRDEVSNSSSWQEGRAPYENGDEKIHFYNYILDVQKAFTDIDLVINSSISYTMNDGFTGSVCAIAEKYGLKHYMINRRIKDGDDINDIVESLLKEKELACFGFHGDLTEICKKFKIMKSLVIYRMNRGMSVEEAVSHNRENFDPNDFMKGKK